MTAASIITPEFELNRTFAALANSTRRAILVRLADGEASVNTLAEPFDMSLPAISKHLKVLESAGLVSRTKNAQYRPCALNTAPLEAVLEWTEQYRPVWENRFDRMDDYIDSLPSTNCNPPSKTESLSTPKTTEGHSNE